MNICNHTVFSIFLLLGTVVVIPAAVADANAFKGEIGRTVDSSVASWLRGIKAQGEIRTQYHYIIDIMPTILEAAGIEVPEVVDGVKQQPLDGVAMNS